MTRILTVLTAILFLASPTEAQAPPQIQPQIQTPPSQITLDDGTILIGKLSQPIELQTKWGKLNIPAQDIAYANLGYNLSDKETAQITQAFKDLNSNNFKERHAAQTLLQNIGERALPLMPKLYGGTMPPAPEDPKDPALEPQRRIQQWIKDCKPDPKYLYDYFDTDEGHIKGKIINKQITLQHDILGELKVDVARIKHIGSHGSVTNTVNSDEDWKEICIVRSRITIKADGLIDLWPQGAQQGQQGQYNCGPKGYNTAGKGGTFMAGTLIGKLDNGLPFIVGDSCTITSQGRFYLRIVENPWNSKSAGTYNIKLDRK